MSQGRWHSRGSGDISPERQLIAAVLRQAVRDAQGISHGHVVSAQHQAEAREFLLDMELVYGLIELAGANPTTVYHVLLRKAGMRKTP